MNPPPPTLAPLVRGLHHIAIAVRSIEEARATYVGLFGLEETAVEHVADQKVNVLVCYTAGQRFELVEPAAADSPISRFLEKRGSGLHHVAWLVDDVAAALARVKAAGLRALDDAPRPGAHGTRVAFLDPKATGGVLTEFVELPKGASGSRGSAG